MPNVVGDMVVRIVGENKSLDDSIDKSKKKLEDFGKAASKIGGTLTKFVTLPLLALGAVAVKSAADMEMMEAAFTTMLGSTKAARDMLQDLVDLSAKTPFQLTNLTAATKTMLAFGIAAEDILPNLKMLGDVAGGNAERLDRITLAFSQIQSTGRLMGQDLLQLVNAGFNPLQIISEQTGKSLATLKDEMAAGAISAEMVAEAFKIATSEGGRFFGGMELASQTLTGQFSTLKDNIVATARSFGNVMLPAIKGIIGQVTKLTQQFTDLDPRTKRIVLNFAAFAAAAGPLVLIVGKSITMIAALKTAMVALNLTMAANPVLLIVAGLVALVTITAIVIKSTGLLRSSNERYAESLKDATEAVKKLSVEEQNRALAAMIQEQLKLQEELAAAQKKQAEAERAWADEQAKLVELGKRATVGTRQMAYAARGVQEAAESATHSTEELAEKSDILNGAIEELNASIGELEEIEARTKATEDQAEADRIAAEEAGTLIGKLGEQLEAEEELLDVQRERLNLTRTADQEAYAYEQAEQERREKAAEEYEARLEKEREDLRLKQEAEAAYFAWYAEATKESNRDRINEEELFTIAVEDANRRRVEMFQWYAEKVREISSNLTAALMDFVSALYSREEQRIIDTVDDEIERDKQIRALRRKEAIMEKSLAAFNIVVNTAVAVSKLLATPWQAVFAGIQGALQLAAVLAEPLPKLATGGIIPATPGGRAVIAGEGGAAEAVIPLDQIGRFLSLLPTPASGDGGTTSVVVNLDGKPIIDTISKASRNRTLIIDSRAVVA